MADSAGAYITEVKEKLDENSLRSYVDKLDNKIDYAKWKQSLVLSYNYMPLQNIKDKIETERRNYLKRMQEEETRLRKIIENKEMITQLELFREFSSKLITKMKEVELKIDAENMKIKVLSTEAEDKRARLKEILKDNMNLTKTFFQQQGINTKSELARMARSHSLKDRLSEISQRSHQNNKNMRGSSNATRTTKYDSMTTLREARSSYEECVKSIVKSMRGMNASEDVQTGIYLDIMSKKTLGHKPKYSTKSNICHTLMDRYGHLNTQKKKESEDFDMTWETFSQLNWKQIMGIILVKDQQAGCLRMLLQ